MKKNLFILCFTCLLSTAALAQDSSRPVSLRFDFGGGEVAEGFIGITSTTAYSEVQGYGFEDGAKITEIIRAPKRKKSIDALSYDFITSEDATPFRFSVKLPEG